MNIAIPLLLLLLGQPTFTTGGSWLSAPTVTGHGVVIAKGEVLTCLHVATALNQTIIRSDPTNDLALVSMTTYTPPVEIATKWDDWSGYEDIDGTWYFQDSSLVPEVICQNESRSYTFTSADVVQAPAGPYHSVEPYNGDFHPGDSGGGIYNGKGELEGLVDATFNDKRSDGRQGAIIPLEEIRAFLGVK